MKNNFILFLLICALISCSKDQNKRKEAIDFIPENSSLVMKINDLASFKNDLKNNELLAAKSPLSFLNTITTDRAIVVAIDQDKYKDSFQYQFITALKDSLFITDTAYVDLMRVKNLKPLPIEKKIIQKEAIYYSVIDNFFVASNSRTSIESMIKNKSRRQISDGANYLNDDAPLSYYLTSPIKGTVIDSLHSNSPELGTLTILDVDISQNGISFRGITSANDSTPNFINYIKPSRPQQNLMADITPDNSSGFSSYTFDNLKAISTKYNTTNAISTDTVTDDISNLINEIGIINLKAGKAFAVRSIDVEAVKEYIAFNSALNKPFRQIAIYDLATTDLLKQFFNPLINCKNGKHFFILNDFLIIIETVEDAEEIISHYTNKQTFTHSDLYKNIQERISDEASYLHFSIAPQLDSVFLKNLPLALTKSIQNKTLKNNYPQVFQIINDNGFAHVNAFIQQYKARRKSNTISEEFTISLESDLLNDPQMVKNHINGQKEIVVQDINNMLYLISNRGKVLWKKKLNGPVLESINQIDIKRNGRLQMAFATSNSVYVLDRNGKNVSPFPLKFNDEITQPLSVFDYDKKKAYRFLVVQGENALMYDGKGKNVKGFNYRSSGSTIGSQPEHFRIGSKDYIVFGSGKKMYLLNRKGQVRVAVKGNIDFSGNGIYLYKNKFTTTNKKGQLVSVDQNGGMSTQNLVLPAKHELTSTSKTLVTLADNKLTIKSKSVELDFGEYTAPEIFYINDKIYVSVTDLQSQKIYVFDSQAKLLKNFPVYGTSSIVLDNIDKDRPLEFVVKGDPDAIVLYQMN